MFLNRWWRTTSGDAMVRQPFTNGTLYATGTTQTLDGVQWTALKITAVRTPLSTAEFVNLDEAPVRGFY